MAMTCKGWPIRLISPILAMSYESSRLMSRVGFEQGGRSPADLESVACNQHGDRPCARGSF